VARDVVFFVLAVEGLYRWKKSTPQRNCLRCGLCCCRQPTPPFMWEDEEFKTLPKDLREGIQAYVAGPEFDDGAPCLWLSSQGCKHYTLRPQICRDFQARGEACEHPTK
jgi:Fe-S-cluster containining protein